MKIKNIAAACLLLSPVLALANTPAQDAQLASAINSLPQFTTMSDITVPLNNKEQSGIAIARDWMVNPLEPRTGGDGSVRYLYGATLPTLVCAPTQVCSLKLEAGEIINDVHAGDTARWNITPATAGSGDTASSLIIIKPINAGLTTNLLVTTDRRIYNVKLVSTKNDWMPVLSFDYPAEVNANWNKHLETQAAQVQATTLDNGKRLTNLNFEYELSGDRVAWTPIRVYDDGVKTHLQFAPGVLNNDAPALLILGDKKGIFKGRSEELVNYRYIDDYLVVDKIFDKAALVLGAGNNQQRVTISREK